MKFIAKIRIDGTKHWFWETFEVETSSPTRHAKDVVAQYNQQIRPGQRRLSFGGFVKIIDRTSVRNHTWRRLRNMGTYYAVQCKRCGITGKQYPAFVERDRKFDSAKYIRCDWK